MNILWCITGAGHLLHETSDTIKRISEKHHVTVVFSSSGYEVAGMYGLTEDIKDAACEVILERDQGPSSPFVGRLGKSKYDRIIVSPCTANTVAKIVYGIADSLITNIVAQGCKRRIPVVVVPTDSKPKVKSKTYTGKEVTIFCRKTDLRNTRKLAEEGVTVVDDPSKILEHIMML